MFDLTASSVGAMLDLHRNFHELLYVLALCSIRIFVIFTVLPATSDQVLPGGARNGIVYAISFFIAAGQPADSISQLNAATALILIGKEMFIGLVIGYAASSVFWVSQSIGVIIDNMAGFNNVQTSNPLRGEQATPVSNILIQLAIVLFYTGGGMMFLLSTIFQSFTWWPLDATMPAMSKVAESFMINRVDSIMTATVKLASPVIFVLVLIDISFGLIAKAAEKLEPMSLSQPLRGVIAMLMLILLLNAFIEQVKTEFTFQGFQSFLKENVTSDATKH
jgi:type III secretion protein T